jgi:peptidoglycan-N-acetylglucosamine deacetylase
LNNGIKYERGIFLRKASVLIIALITLLSLIGCTSIVAERGEENQHDYQEEGTSEPSDISDQDENPEIDLVFHAIKGTSDNLNPSTRKRMDQWRKDIVSRAEQYPDLIFINGHKKEKLVALTFDDGPDQRVTPQVIAILNEHNVVGNFFFLGENSKALPQIVKEAHESGHQIYAHSLSHSNYTNKGYDYIFKDFQRTNQILKDITGVQPPFMRPPYGIVTDYVIQAAQAHEQKIIIWSTDTLDWSQREKDNIVRNVLEHVRPGEIVLMHSIGSNQATAAALPEIIDGLHNQGFRIVGLDQLLE